MHAGLLGLIICVLAAGASAASAGSASTGPKPVIGRPVAVPSQASPGKRLTVIFRVTRSDSGAPLTRGRMICEPSYAGKVIAHAESFKQGLARVSFVVPVAANGKVLRVKVTIQSAGSTATRIASLQIRALPKPSISVADASVVEGSEGSSTLSFAVSLSAATPLSVAAHYAISDGTAVAASDYTAAGGVVTFKPGQTTTAVTVAVASDKAVEPDETLTVTLSSPVNASIADGTATGTIKNDDVAARDGPYSGSTAQWKYIAFEVGSGATALWGLYFFVDLTCDTPLSFIRDAKVWVEGTIPVDPEGRFVINSKSTVGSNMVLTLSVAGKLTAPGSASGTVRVVDYTGVYGGPHCWTEDIYWTAS